uniref:Rhomboid domain-containing protein n=1 Tax=Panagrellus redivivus TaxID=6233 RepID=A0A7E4ZVW9_PANRE
MDKMAPTTPTEELSQLFHVIDVSNNELVTNKELNGLLRNDRPTRLSIRQKQVLSRQISRMSKDDYMDLTQFEDLLTSPSTKDTFWKKFVVIMGDLTTPADRKLKVRDYLAAYSCCPPAIFLFIISIIQVVIFALYGPSDEILNAFEFHGPWRHQIYRYFSYVFVHADLTHLTGNILMQLFCVPCEVVDHWRVWIIYVVGAVFGSSSYYILYPNGQLVGASAAVFSLLAINIAELIMNWSQMPLRHLRLVFYGSYILIHISEVSMRLIYASDDSMAIIAPEVAHFAGFLGGILLGLIMVKNLKVEQHEIVIRTVCIIFFSLLVVALIGLNCFDFYEIAYKV